MKKTILTVVLLSFVGVCLAMLVVKGFHKPEPVSQPAVNAVVEKEALPESRVVAYYFHGTARCTTCRTIEAYAQQAIEENFADALDQGLLTWSAVNVEEPENAHFIKDFNLTIKTVVLAKLQDDKPVEWKALPEVWTLVRDENSFKDFIWTETQGFLEKL